MGIRITNARTPLIKRLLLAIGVLFSLFVQAEDPLAYRIYDGKGKQSDWSAILASVEPGSVVLFGELHNNAISHWLQLRLLQSLHQSYADQLVLGMEMFEADDQVVLNEYLAGNIKEKNFKADARFWKNYGTDYKPLVEFCKENSLSVIASNVPRRYASMVYSGGFESLDGLSAEAKSWMPPLPIPYDAEQPAYQEMLEMMGSGHGGENFPKAQAIKDATMAYFSAKHLPEKGVLLHLNGAFHSDNQQGIAWYLPKYRENVTQLTITTKEVDDPATFDDKELRGTADFIILVAEDLTKTH